jgi:hypothetical protein
MSVKIDKQEFIAQCKAVNPQFSDSSLPGLLSKIDNYNAARGNIANTPRAAVDTSFLKRIRKLNPQIQDSILTPVDEDEPGVYNKILLQESHSKAAQAGVELQGALRSLPPDAKAKYAGPLAYLQSCIQAKIAKPDESMIFKMSVSVSSRKAPLDLRGEGFPSLAFLEEIAKNLKIICPLIHELASPQRPGGPRTTWFASESLNEVQSAIVNLDMYLNHRCSRLTFKVLPVGSRCDNDEVRGSLAGQVLPTVMLKGQDRPDFRRESGYLQVPSGLRIFLGPLYFSVRTNYDEMLSTVAIYRFMTLFHELTHKIIKTVDKVYELPRCRAIKDSADAVMCADSWGYFLTDYAAQSNRLPGAQTSKVGVLRAKFGG